MRDSLPSSRELQLLGLVIRERSGQEVAALFKERFGHEIPLGTMYTTFRRMVEAGWIAARDGYAANGRARFFRASASGTQALQRASIALGALASFAKSSLREAQQ